MIMTYFAKMANCFHFRWNILDENMAMKIESLTWPFCVTNDCNTNLPLLSIVIRN